MAQEFSERMICATKVLRPGGYRVGRIAGNITLPRTVSLSTAIAVVVSAIVFVLVGAVVGLGLGQLFYAFIIGGFFGWVLSNVSPMRGESLFTWLSLKLSVSRRTKRIDGKPVVVGVGTALARRVPVGLVDIRRGCISVQPGSYDSRGVLVPSAPRVSTHTHQEAS